MIFDIKNPVQAARNFERRRSLAIGAQKEGFRSGVKESYTNQNIISIAPGADIQKAIDAVYASGGGTVVLLTGTHIREESLFVYPNVTLRGETTGTELDFNNSSHGIVVTTTEVAVTGTIGVTNNSTTVTGSGTSFSEELVGLGLFIDGSWNYVLSVDSATQLTLDAEYAGPTQSGLTVVAADVQSNVSIKSLIVRNSMTAGISVSYAYIPILEEVNVYDSTIGIESNYVEFFYIDNGNVFTCGTGIVFEETYSCSIRSFLMGDCTGDGIQWTNAGDSTMFDFGIVGCGGNGMTLTNCDALTCLSFTIADNAGKGVEFVSSCDDNQLIGGKVNRNGSDGIKLTATSDRNGFIGLTCDTNTGYGINIAAASCDNNMVSSCALVSNTAGQISNSGTGTKARGIIGNVDIG